MVKENQYLTSLSFEEPTSGIMDQLKWIEDPLPGAVRITGVYLEDFKEIQSDIPANIKVYMGRHDDDWGLPITIEPRVFANSWGYILIEGDLVFENPDDLYVEISTELGEDLSEVATENSHIIGPYVDED